MKEARDPPSFSFFLFVSKQQPKGALGGLLTHVRSGRGDRRKSGSHRKSASQAKKGGLSDRTKREGVSYVREGGTETHDLASRERKYREGLAWDVWEKRDGLVDI